MRKDDAPCEYCGKIMNHRCDEKWKHFMQCEKAQQLMKEGIDYVVCPICGVWKEDLGSHLVKHHHIPKGKRKDLFPDLQVQCQKFLDRKDSAFIKKYGGRSSLSNPKIKQKAIKTTRKNYGVDNPFASSEVQDKIKSTNVERYGHEYPMQNEDIFCKQQKSANASPNKLEQFFDEYTCDSVVFTGYGGRYIRTKTGVRKFGRVVKNLCPDFMIFQDDILESARERSKEKKKLSNQKHRTRYVIEILGDYYHSEEVIGVPTEEHEEELIDAYASVGIRCLTIWENDIVRRWNDVQSNISDWISHAVEDLNDRPIHRQYTKAKIDSRIARFECPYGSGEKFKTQEQLDEWMVSNDNLYRVGLVRGDDFVICAECGKRFRKLGIHLARTHKMSEEDYLAKHPSSQIVASNEVYRISSRLKSKTRGSYQKRIAYRLPNGDIVRKKIAWQKAWGSENPPSDSIIDASKIDDIDPWADKKEGIDYVVCRICGFKGRNIKRHVKREHGLEGYDGPLKSEDCIKALSDAANKSWETKGNKSGITREVLEKLLYEEKLSRKEACDRLGIESGSMSHYCKKFGIVVHPPKKKKVEVREKKVACGLNERILKKLYCEDLLHDGEIAEMFGITKDGVAYYRRKYGVKAITDRERISIRARRDGKPDIEGVSRDAFIELLEKHSYKELAEMFGCSKMLIFKKVKELGIGDE